MDDVTPARWPHTPICASHDSGGEMWLTRKPTEQAVAAMLCLSCPVRQPCHEYAETLRALEVPHHEPNPRPWGVWGGLLYDGSTRAPTPLPLPIRPVLGPKTMARKNAARTRRARIRRLAS